MTKEEAMRHWDALKTTDPKYTKPVTFGRKFTSINSQWQLQRMTERFGPIGDGWGYRVGHGIERITDDYVLAIADVEIWWAVGDGKAGSYGPVRGMSPIVERGKNGLHFDDDAGKKAMTDALTKGLSHLGLSADVFLGLFDDNKYVRQVTEKFSHPTDFVEEAVKDGLAKPDAPSQYNIDKLKKAIANEWIVSNTTPKGKEEQIFAYLEMARNPDEVAKIGTNNAALISAAPWKDEFEAGVDRLLQWFEKEAAPQ